MKKCGNKEFSDQSRFCGEKQGGGQYQTQKIPDGESQNLDKLTV
jgi:hypothetical protein